jgi:hypothetical protein
MTEIITIKPSTYQGPVAPPITTDHHATQLSGTKLDQGIFRLD